VLTLALYALLAVLVGTALFLLAAHVLPAGEQIAPALRDEPPWKLPVERRLTAHDVAGVRLPVALRGYRFAETDLLLDRLAEELRARDEEIARLRGELPPDESTAGSTAGSADEPSRTPAGEPSRAEPSRAEPSTAEPSTAEPSTAPQDSAASTDDPVDAGPGRHDG
jgi:DivIVA domain-containing protein